MKPDAMPLLESLDYRTARRSLERPSVEAVQVRFAELTHQPYRSLVRSLIANPPFMADLQGSVSDMVARLANICAERVVPDDDFLAQRREFLRDFTRAVCFAANVIDATRVVASVRNWFAPGDSVWHVDRSRRRQAVRVLWPLGRTAGMRVMSRTNIDDHLYDAYIRREHPLLCRLDRLVYERRRPADELWRHRPRQLAMMRSGVFPFVRDAADFRAVLPSALSVHKIETPSVAGTFHSSSWANVHTPGLQVIITSTR